jgi:lyso-ornithine lipid O-acyltransferase
VLSETAHGLVTEMYEGFGLEAGASVGWEHDSELVGAL